jgi:SAM-dependent methyltransferase
MPSLAEPPGTTALAAYFDGLYGALASSGVFSRIGREAFGDGFVGQLGCAGEAEFFRLAELAGAGPGRTVLDLCSGSGGLTSWLARRTGASLVGVDCSPVGLRLGRFIPARTPAFVRGDVDALPFRGGSFDGVVSLDGFSFRTERLAAECRRILRPSGTLAMLISLPAAGVAVEASRLADAGFRDAWAEDGTAAAIALASRWLAAFRRHAREHVIEVGESYHRGITGELETLLRGYESGRVRRVFLVARGAPPSRDAARALF